MALRNLLRASRLPRAIQGAFNLRTGAVGTCRHFSWDTVPVGDLKNPDFLLHYTKKGDSKFISPWHDIPLQNEEGQFHFVNEIPLGTTAKMEVDTKSASNPIKQDVKKGKLRFFTYGKIPFNYGCFPQTWEDPHTAHPLTNYVGDNDPVDVCEISGEPVEMGAVTTVKVLGILAMIDEGETDWKVLAIRSDHPLAEKLNDVEDVDTYLPGTTAAIHEWFKMYKTTDGKPENEFAFEGKVQPKALAEEIIAETNQSWKDLCAGKIPAGKLAIPPTP